MDNDKIKLGYACLNLTLKTKFKDVTLKTLEKLDTVKKIEKLNSIALSNTNLVDEIIRFNSENDIGLYRIPTNLLPFPTHPIASEWNWRNTFQPSFEYTGSLANNSGIRISFHADEYTIVNSPVESVFNNSKHSLIYLADVLDMMKVNGNIVIHVGGVYGNKEESSERFIKNFFKLPEHVRVKLIIENDDKLYSWKDVYDLCCRLNVPMVLDIHHYKVLEPESTLSAEEIDKIFSTWNGKKPKIHLSSPKNEKDIRAHADYVDINDFIWFYEKAINQKYDIMLEAKSKELAVIRFRSDFNKYKNYF